MTYTVYRATNSINGKAFVGIDPDWPSERMRHESVRGDTEVFHRALRKYGPPLFRWEALLHTNDELEANSMAFQMMKETVAPAGYNTPEQFTIVRTIANDSVASSELTVGLNGTSGEDLDVLVSKITENNGHPLAWEDEPKAKKSKITEQGRQKISDAVSRPVEVDGVKYRSIKDAAEKLGLPRHQVKMVIRGVNSVAYYKAKNQEASK